MYLAFDYYLVRERAVLVIIDHAIHTGRSKSHNARGFGRRTVITTIKQAKVRNEWVFVRMKR